MTKRIWLGVVLCSLLAVSSASAGPITWGAATTIAGDSDVSTTGTFKYAYHWNSGDTTVNGVTFTGTTSTTAGGSDVGLSGFTAHHPTFTSALSPFVALSTAYKATLSGAPYNSGATVTVTLKNLTIGNQYAVQVWIEDPRSYGNGRSATLTSSGGNSVVLDYNSTNAEGGVGQYSIGTFTADAVTQTFTIAVGVSVQLNALQVREVSGPLTVSLIAPVNGQVFLAGSSVTATVAVASGTINYQTVAFYTNGVSAWSTNNTSSTLFTIPLGVLGAGTYTNYAYVLDATNGVAYSSTNTFSVVAPATYYWDTDGSTAGFGDTAGTWGSSAFWSTDSTGASATANPTITAFDSINFGTDTLALGSTASAVGVSGAVTVNSITFGAAQAAPVTLSGGTSITLGGTSPTITVKNASNTISSVLAGTAGMTKAGSGTLTLSGANTLTGTTTISAGVLKLQGNAFMTTPRNYSIASGAVLNLDGSSINKLPGSTSTISGTGTLRLTGGILFGNSSSSGNCNLSLSSGAVIDVQAGASMQNGGWTAFNWSANYARLNVDGQFDIAEAAATVDALTGAGRVIKSWDANTRVLTVGIASGSGTFSGTITNGTGTIALTKNGTGTQTLSGTNNYTGNTTVSAGALKITGTGRIYSAAYNSSAVVAVSSGAVLELDSWSYGASESLGQLAKDAARITINGGTIRMNGNTTYGRGVTVLAGGATFEAAGANWTQGGPFDFTANVYTGNPSLTFTGAGTGTFAKVFSGSGALTKSGAGTWTLTATNTYTGATTINGGTLLVNGSSAAGSTNTVTAGTLGGSGIIGGNVKVLASGNLAPGSNGAGTLSIGGTLDISALAGGKLYFQLDAPAATSDKVAVTGGLTIGSGTLGFSDFNFTKLAGSPKGVYKLITSSGIIGTLDSSDLSGAVPGIFGNLTLGINGNDIELVIIPSGTLISFQ